MALGSERTSHPLLILGTETLGLRASKALANALDTLGSRITKLAVMLDVAILFPRTQNIVSYFGTVVVEEMTQMLTSQRARCPLSQWEGLLLGDPQAEEAGRGGGLGNRRFAGHSFR